MNMVQLKTLQCLKGTRCDTAKYIQRLSCIVIGSIFNIVWDKAQCTTLKIWVILLCLYGAQISVHPCLNSCSLQLWTSQRNMSPVTFTFQDQVDAEVKILLSLKGQYKDLTGEDVAGGGKGKKDKKDKKKDAKPEEKKNKEAKKADKPQQEQKAGGAGDDGGAKKITRQSHLFLYREDCTDPESPSAIESLLVSYWPTLYN